MPGRRIKKTGYAPTTLAKRLIEQRHEVELMIEDERITEESGGEVWNALDEAITALYDSYCSVKEDYTHDRASWETWLTKPREK